MNHLLKTLWLLLGLMTGCTLSIPADPISAIRSGQSYNRLGEYLVTPGDTLLLNVRGEESLTGSFVVNPQGNLSLPLLGEVPVAGQSLTDLQKNLSTKLKKYIKNPNLSIQLTDSRTTVFMSGEIQSLGPLLIREKTNLLQAIAQAGGLSDFASGRLVLMRDRGTEMKGRYEVEYDDLLSGDGNLDFFYLENGDIIHAE